MGNGSHYPYHEDPENPGSVFLLSLAGTRLRFRRIAIGGRLHVVYGGLDD